MISLSKVTKVYRRGGETLKVLDALDLEIQDTEFCALMGPSGSGKSTLLNVIGGLDHADSGTVRVGDEDLTQLSDNALAAWRADNVGFVFQGFNLIPVLTALENVELPLLLTPLSRSKRREHARYALELVGLTDRAKHRPSQLSGGQEQRAAIARALVTDPQLILADEPTGDLDRVSADQVLELLERLRAELNKTVLVVTHDPLAAERAGRVIYLDKGRLGGSDETAERGAPTARDDQTVPPQGGGGGRRDNMMHVPLRLVAKNLFRHPLRTLLTIASLTVAVFLLCVLRSIVVTLDAGVKSAQSDRIIVQSAVSLFVDLPLSYESKILAVDGVERTCKWQWFGGYYQDQSNFFAQFGVDQDSLVGMYPEVVFEAGSEDDFRRTRTSCLIGIDLASDFGWKLGDAVPIISALFPRVDGDPWVFEVAGIYRSQSSNVDNRTLFFHYDYLQKSVEQGSASGPPGVGIYVVQAADGAEPIEVMSRIDALFENGPQRVQSTSEAEFQKQFVSMVGNVPFFVSSIGGGVFVAILLAVVNTMLMAAREQTRDVGILKALGFGSGAIFMVLLLQGLFLGLLGGGLGLILARASSESFATMLGASFPNYEVTLETLGLGVAVSLVVGVLAGIFPAIRLSRLPCVQSLRAEG